MTERILLSAPDVGPAERAALLRAFDAGWIAPVGPELDAFEREVAVATGRQYAVALASGTAALHLALVELGVGRGDRVVAPTFTFAATVNPIRYCGAQPVLIDAEARTWGMDPELLEAELRRRALRDQLPKAIVVADLYGQVCDHDALEEVASSFDVPVVADAAESLGARTATGSPAGSRGRLAAVSFNGNKIITTSGGGALLTDDPDVAARARSRATQARLPLPHYEHDELGFNYRLSNLLAAMGRAQLASLEGKVDRRRAIARRYRAAFADLDGVTFGPQDVVGRTNAWLTVIRLGREARTTAGELRLVLDGAGIEARPVWKPMHRQPLYRGAPAVLNGTSDRAFSTSLCLPSGSALTDAQVDRVIEAVVRRVRERS